ncbi:uncharacterized protein L203_105014 [Cryptococcus depauperatus CBS 7841]|uniref:Uncharacterized protein n=1 Tax=Cryptococcus depauperatus CBS 7841 TaxID=1295531 RepID=A0A1E3I396_9TREE|nr:hypothetical protein L203_05480 [Cryptococcus depauperatus CBS 7841]
MSHQDPAEGGVAMFQLLYSLVESLGSDTELRVRSSTSHDGFLEGDGGGGGIVDMISSFEMIRGKSKKSRACEGVMVRWAASM